MVVCEYVDGFHACSITMEYYDTQTICLAHHFKHISVVLPRVLLAIQIATISLEYAES